MSLTDKTIASTYKDWLIIDNANAGFDTNLDQVKSGNGVGSALYLSKDGSKLQPNADSTTLKQVFDKDGNLLFLIDSTNDYVKLGINQYHANTQYAYFGIDSLSSATYGSTDHIQVPFGIAQTQTAGRFGTGTNPDTSYTISTDADDIVVGLWYIPDGITIDACSVWVGGDASTGDTIRFHLMSFDIDTSNTSTGGDLSNGVVLADGSDITTAGYEQAYYQQMTIQSSAVTSGKVVMFFFKNDTTNSDYSIKATVKYHLT